MAALPPKGPTVTRRPSLKGLLMQDVSNGVERQRRWPRDRGKTIPKETREQMEWFRQAQWATKYMDPKMLMTFVRATQDTPLLPRDIATMMFAGRLFNFTTAEGRKIYAMSNKTDVSESLDALSQTEGHTLIRGPEFWTSTPPIVANRQGAVITRPLFYVIGAADTWRSLPLSTEVMDQSTFWNAAQPTRITVPLQGWYNMTFESNRTAMTGAYGGLAIFKNGVIQDQMTFISRTSGGGIRQQIVSLQYLNAGDYVEPHIYDASSVCRYANSRFVIVGNA